MTGKGGEDAPVETGVAALQAAWSERAASDARLVGRADALLAREDDTFETVVRSVVARSDGEAVKAEHAEGAARAALAAGRAAYADDVDLLALQRLFGHLNDVVTKRVLRRATDADGHLCPVTAVEAVRRVRDAMERPVIEATRGWFDEAARKLRHDVKTPLQATSLNLELLTLESAERGLDTEALDTIQRSLDQVVELLARAEPADG